MERLSELYMSMRTDVIRLHDGSFFVSNRIRVNAA